MILRRLTEHLKQQQWTAIGIELVIVVLGVFLGLQVSNWNEERIERQRTTQVLEGLRADMRDYIDVQRTLSDKATRGLAAFDAARASGKNPVPYFLRVRGSETPPTSVWQVAQQSGLAELVHPSLMFELGFFYSEIQGIGVKFGRYSRFVDSEILPRLGEPQAFYDEKDNLKTRFQQNMQRLREWTADGGVTLVSAECLLKRFETPKDAGPSCRPDYASFVDDETKP
ncbi:MAG TPA: hypothetical protein VFN25_05295 [Dokdonella sp.]|uniref:hypothetical protein n=1 Tax=Dokdonella sp. TaxID=2291710 RepID=UPI002D80A497|nr:hypothetical protein [Dokdonella sp.]HET9032305.1 hypothetical protein [Dokdonella sp.]